MAELKAESPLHLFILLAGPRPRSVLTVLDDHSDPTTGHPPVFISKPDDFAANKWHINLRDLLGIPDFEFELVAHLNPEDNESLTPFYNPLGKKRILLLRTLKSALPSELPSGVAWSDFKHMRKNVLNRELAHGRYFRVLSAFAEVFNFDDLSDNPFNWFLGAFEFARHIICDHEFKPVSKLLVHNWHSHSSALFKMSKIDQGGRPSFYFLKSLLPGDKESSITEKVCSLFPQYTPAFIARSPPDDSEHLHCFITDEFQPYDESISVQSSIDREKLILILADIHLKSRAYLDVLLQAGVPDRRPEILARELRDGLLYDKRIAPVIKVPSCNDDRLGYDIDQINDQLIQLCDELTNGPCESTLLHGDFALRNSALRQESPILHDWEFSCISHPFCDLGEIQPSRNDLDSYVTVVAPTLLGNYEAIDRMQSVGGVVAWIARVRMVLELVDAAKHFKHKHEKALFYLSSCVEMLTHRLHTFCSGNGINLEFTVESEESVEGRFDCSDESADSEIEYGSIESEGHEKS